MAATLTLLSASPYALKYQYAYDGVASQLAVIGKPTMLADLVAGNPGNHSPLLDLLTGATGAPFAALDTGPSLSLYLTPQLQSVGASNIVADLTSPLGVDRLEVNGVGLVNLDRAIVEVRFNHTIDR